MIRIAACQARRRVHSEKMMSEPSSRKGAGVVWERSEPARRPPPTPLSRAKIVGAAMALADAEGLEAVSMRNVAARLKASPMRLYGFVATKEELLDLLVDEIFGEMTGMGPFEGDWRAVLGQFATHIRRAWRAHKWFVDLLGGRPHLGPHALTFIETVYAALIRTEEFADIDFAMFAVSTVNAYAVGAIRTESSEFNTGASQDEWENATWPYLQRQLATGRFPMLEQIVTQAEHPQPDVLFEQGLSCVLDGIHMRLQARRAQ